MINSMAQVVNYRTSFNYFWTLQGKIQSAGTRKLHALNYEIWGLDDKLHG